jgi:hypothetical protein
VNGASLTADAAELGAPGAPAGVAVDAWLIVPVASGDGAGSDDLDATKMPPPATATTAMAMIGQGVPFDGSCTGGAGRACLRFFFEPISGLYHRICEHRRPRVDEKLVCLLTSSGRILHVGAKRVGVHPYL